MTYKVLVDDNFNLGQNMEAFFSGEEPPERDVIGEFATPEEALAACKRIVQENIEAVAKPGMTGEQIFAAYKSFGSDPFVRGVEFSAWGFAKELAERKEHQDTIDTLLKPKG